MSGKKAAAGGGRIMKKFDCMTFVFRRSLQFSLNIKHFIVMYSYTIFTGVPIFNIGTPTSAFPSGGGWSSRTWMTSIHCCG